MDVIVLIGRILFVVIFLGSGAAHLRDRKAMAGYATAKGVPSAEAVVVGTGVLQLVAGVLILLGVWADLGALLLFLFLLPTAIVMHNFWTHTDAQTRAAERIHFVKDISLAGASLMLFAFFAYVGRDLGLTLTGPLFPMR